MEGPLPEPCPHSNSEFSLKNILKMPENPHASPPPPHTFLLNQPQLRCCPL